MTPSHPVSDPPTFDPLSQSRDRLRRLVEHLPAGAVYVEGEQIVFNAATAAIIGYTLGELPTLTDWFTNLYPGRADQIRALYTADRFATFPHPRVVSLTRKDGEERLVEFAGYAEAAGELWLLRDVTESARVARLMEQTTRATEVGGWEVDARTLRIYWTDETYRIHETTPHEYTPNLESAIAFYAPESVPLITDAVQRGFAEGEPFDLELQLITAKKHRIWVRAVGVAERQDGRTVKLYGSFQNISKRRAADEALRLSEEQKRRLISSSPDCLLELNLAGDILSVNPRAVELLEVEDAGELLGRQWLDLWPTESHAGLQEALELARQGKEARRQAFGPTRRGTPRWWDAHVTAIRDAHGQAERLLVSARDITPIKQAEREREEFQHNLLQTQKLESLGVLAGGIAHDFNNLLTGILGNNELIRIATPSDSPTTVYLDQIDRSAHRAADLCRQMLAYAGKGRFVVESIDLSSLVQDTAKLLSMSVSKKATLSMSLASGLPPILADVTQLRQVLMNLVINASEALGDQEGLIAISTGKSLAEGEAEQVYLQVSDTGCGMEEATRARIFEPFFTTKFTGRGLGLSAVLGIVRGHHGVLDVTSKVGQGSTFRLSFPATLVRRGVARSAHERSDWHGWGKVLLVEDEEPLRAVGAGLLASFGFEVVHAADGWEAIQELRHLASRVRLVLLDLTMPRLDGEQTLEQMRPLVPGVPIILMSGYNERELSERFGSRGLAGFLQKPFTREQLGRKLREALGE